MYHVYHYNYILVRNAALPYNKIKCKFYVALEHKKYSMKIQESLH